MRKNADTEERRNVHSEFVGNLNSLQQCMAKQDLMEQAYDSSGEEEEAKEPEKKGGFFGKFLGGQKAKKKAPPTSMNIGSVMNQRS
jgi:hypothetical protein